MKLLSIIVLVSLLYTTTLFAAKDAIQFKDFFTVDRLGTPVVSSDGQKIAFTVKKANINENNYATQIWLMDKNGENQTEITSHPSANTNPVFSPDGKMLYFLR